MRTRSGVPPRRGVLAAWAAETEREDQEAEAKALGLTRQKFDALQLGARPNAGIGRADSAFLRSPVPVRPRENDETNSLEADRHRARVVKLTAQFEYQRCLARKGLLQATHESYKRSQRSRDVTVGRDRRT